MKSKLIIITTCTNTYSGTDTTLNKGLQPKDFSDQESREGLE